MIIIETKTNVHIFHDTDINHVEYNRELNSVRVSFMDEGLWEEKIFDDVLDLRYLTNACPKAYEYKSSEQGRMLRELEERRSLDFLNYRLTRTLFAACGSLQKGDYKAEEYEKSIDKMLEERNEIHDRIAAINK